jgi:hypothetical protein
MNEILALYEQNQRKQVQYYGMRTEQMPDVVRLVALDGGEGAVIYSHLNETNADRVIREQIAYFEGLDQNFEWKLFDYDTPTDLRERLIAHGFEIEEAESIMVLDLDTAPAALFEPIKADVRRVDASQMDQVVQVLNEVWNDDHEGLGKYLTGELTHHGGYLSIYIAYVDGIPASTAWIRFHENSQFAGLWGGSSIEAYRQRGLYTALLAVRAQEARQRGVRYLTIDASPMSQPIVAKQGFQILAISHACKKQVKQASED